MKKVLMLSILVLAACTLNAAVYTTTVSDTGDGNGTGGQTIASASWGEDATNYYFKIVTDSDILISSFASIYAIYIDDNVNSLNSSAFNYIPNTLTGIDTITDEHFSSDGSSLSNWSHYHQYATTTSVTTVAGPGVWNGTDTIEWTISKASLSGSFAVTVGSHNDSVNVTHDLVDLGTVPEPATMALLGLGMLGLRRRKK